MRRAIREEPADYEAPSRSAREAPVTPIRDPVQPAMPLPVRATDAPPLPSPLYHPTPLDDDDPTDLQISKSETLVNSTVSKDQSSNARARLAYTVEWLEEEMNFVGTLAFVEKYGVTVVQAALREYVRIRERAAPIRSPSGLLRWLVKNL